MNLNSATWSASPTAVTGFYTTRASVQRAMESGTVIRHASDAQRSLIMEEGRVRHFALLRDSTAVPLAREARMLAVMHLRELWSSVGPEQRVRVDSIVHNRE